MDSNDLKENIAATLARVLPTAEIIATIGEPNTSLPAVLQIAVPKSFDLKEVDFEKLLPNPRRTKGTATFSDARSFIDYIATHARNGTTVWCDFDPQTFGLSFTGVLDEHSADLAGWRQHKAVFKPAMSAEWKAWTGNQQPKGQIEFAEYLERHETDIATQEGYPTSLQMMKMATEFEANSEKAFKSVARLQGGGVRMQYVNDDDARTLEEMKVFEKFQIGIPVFWAGSAYRIDARLKYRHGQGKVNFYYELIRADRVHDTAARELIAEITAGIGDVPLLMGSCT